MKESTLGRTNRVFPPVWLKLQLKNPSSAQESLSEFVEAATALKLPLDISVSPALFGGLIQNIGETVISQVSSTDFERATDAKHAADLVQAHLIETLSGIGRPYVDFYFLRFRRTLEESQLSGIMEALESARQEGHIKYFGLHAENLGGTLGNWQFHDAFDVISVPDTLKPEDRDTLRRMARQRRTGFVLRTDRWTSTSPDVDATLVPVANIQDLLALGAVI